MTRPDRCPYGWRPDPSDQDQLVEAAVEQATIRRIREERRVGRGLREIAVGSTRPASRAAAAAGRTRPSAQSCGAPNGQADGLTARSNNSARSR